ncbi:hypothetical protein PSN_2632 [Pseudomonas sp. NGC7]
MSLGMICTVSRDTVRALADDVGGVAKAWAEMDISPTKKVPLHALW